ncbi:MAG: hypothetical protein H3C35_09160 [Bacteroidetes bacterium]|nr:hypothetical protein [Bacteroidota bacterium]
MEETLKLLYQLQKIDNKLDDVNESKGDLPNIVASLEEQFSSLNNQIGAKREYIDSFVASRNKADDDVQNFEEKLKRYKDQQYKVRSNKEYDAITKEIETTQDSIKTLTKQFEDFENQMSVAKNELTELEAKQKEIEEALTEKKSELVEVSKATDDEEEKYTKERKKVTAHISAQYLSKYTMIREHRGRVTVAIIRKNSCSGCGNRIPPQHIMEIRKNEKLYLCQHCGRIIVSDELAQQVVVE